VVGQLDLGLAAFIADHAIVTPTGGRVLSANLPRNTAELERMIGR